MTKKKAKRVARSIVIGHVEKVSRHIFDTYKKQITSMIKGHHGVYALYRRNTLYYIGLATNLRNRINTHLKDKHSKSWTHFSLYIFKRQNYIRELEALLLRIAYPEGNSQKGKLKGSSDLKPVLKQLVKKEQSKELDDLFKAHKPAGKKKPVAANRPLKGLFKGGKMIYATYQGKDYKAWVNSNGRISFDGKFYDSPSVAGKAARKKSTNGWRFWKYKDKGGKLRPIGDLRKG